MKDLPRDLLTALQSAALESVFLHLPPSHQNEYIQWIEQAKKSDTRRKRIEDTLKRLKGHHD